MPDRKEMSDKNLREAIAWHQFSEAEFISQMTIDSIHAAIAKDREEERLLFKKIEGELEENNMKNISTD